MALLLTFISGLFFLVGIVIYKYVKNKNSLNRGAIATATVVIMGLIFFDLIPELLEVKKWWLILFIILGLGILSFIDKLVPHHHHDHHENDEEEMEHKEHLEHIGTVIIFALLLHNAIEGMALYGIASSDIKKGLLMLLGIGLHNIPFGFQIANYKNNKILLSLLVLSGFFGGVIFACFGEISAFFEGIIIAITLGMLLHILVFELLGEVKENIGKKETIYGIIIGIVLSLVVNLI